MSFIKQSTDSAREAFLAMPMQSRVITVMLAIAIALGLGLLVQSDKAADTEYLLGGQSFDLQELAAAEKAFSQAGLSDWKREGQRILVPTSSKSEYYSAMGESSALPMSMQNRVQDAIDKTTVFDSNDLRQSREAVAKEQELADTIMKFPDIRLAKVDHDRGERLGLGRNTPQSCSIFVQPNGFNAIPHHLRENILNLVQSAYAGLAADEIMLVDANGTSTSAINEDDPMLRKQREAETWIEGKVRKLLIEYPAKIAVTAEIDPTMDVEKTVLTYDAEPTNLQTKSRKIESATNRPIAQGVPGAVPNAIGNRAASIDETQEIAKIKEDERETQGVAGQQYENSKLASLQVKKVKVSVGLPSSFYERELIREKMRKDPTLTAEAARLFQESDLEDFKAKINRQLKMAISPLLPAVASGGDPLPLVTIWESSDAPIAEPAQQKTAELALAWLASSWQTMALIGLGVFALLVARSAAKGINGGSTPPEFVEGFGLELPAPPVEEDESEDEESDTMTITGESLKDELMGLVDSNPEVAANVLRGWVSGAA